MLISRKSYAIVMGMFLVAGCGPSYPLSVTLMNPKTQMVRKCSARESGPQDVPMLARAVEACAQQLEARGFVRVDNVPDDSKPTSDLPKSAPAPSIR
jgi:hypothetical protein